MKLNLPDDAGILLFLFFGLIKGEIIIDSFTHVGQYVSIVSELNISLQPSTRLQTSTSKTSVEYIVIGSISTTIVIDIDFISSFYICLTHPHTIRGVN
jgi:hypothetical protein